MSAKKSDSTKKKDSATAKESMKAKTGDDPLDIKDKIKPKKAKSSKNRSKKYESKKSSKPAQSWLSHNNIIAAVGVLIVILLFIIIVSPGSSTPNEEVLENVSSLVTDLPAEDPIIATIENAEAITSQDNFYTGSENGDKVLVYPNSNRAIIYRPSDNSIVKDGLVSIQ